MCKCAVYSFTITITTRHALSDLSNLHLGESVPVGVCVCLCARQLPTHCDSAVSYSAYCRIPSASPFAGVSLAGASCLPEYSSVYSGRYQLAKSSLSAVADMHEAQELALVCTRLNRVAMCCSSCCFRVPGLQRMHHHQQICLVYDSFASSSISLSL